MFDLTRQEKAIITFLVVALIFGLGVMAYRKMHSAVKVEISDYTIEDERMKGIDELIDQTKRININEASVEELMKLNGIGKVLAERIIDYRQKRGRFKSAQEIKNVKGVGEGLFAKFEDDISIE